MVDPTFLLIGSDKCLGIRIGIGGNFGIGAALIMTATSTAYNCIITATTSAYNCIITATSSAYNCIMILYATF